MEIKRKEEDWNEWYGLDEMVMLGSTCLRLTEKEKGEKQGLGGKGHRTRRKKKRKQEEILHQKQKVSNFRACNYFIKTYLKNKKINLQGTSSVLVHDVQGPQLLSNDTDKFIFSLPVIVSNDALHCGGD